MPTVEAGKEEKQKDEYAKAITPAYSKEVGINLSIKWSLTADLGLTPYPGFLCGHRVWLRPTFPTDHEALQDAYANPDNMKFLGDGLPWSKQEVEERTFRNAHKNLSQTQISQWSTMISHGGIAGCFWVYRNQEIIPDIKDRKENEEAEIAFCVRPGFAGRGLTTEAGKVVVNSMLPYFKGVIFATVHPKNKGSQCVLEKIGLQPDPERQGVPKFGSTRNYYQMHIKEASDSCEEISSFFNKRKLGKSR